MSEDPPGTDPIAGLPVDEAAEVVAEQGAADSAAAARTALEAVCEDGTVTEAGLDDAIAHLSKVISTPETRLELAEIELADSREAAEPVEDLELVRARLDGYAERVEAVREELEALGADLQALLDGRESATIYESARTVQELTATANRLQRTADEVQMELEEFGRWLSDPGRRAESLEEDLDALEAALDELAAAAEEPEAASGWFDAVLRSRGLAAVVEDLRWELEQLGRWPGQEEGAAGLSADDDRLESLAERRERVEAELDRSGRPEWRERFADRLAEAEAAIQGFEPPVDWGALDAALDEHRPAPDQ